MKEAPNQKVQHFHLLFVDENVSSTNRLPYTVCRWKFSIYLFVDDNFMPFLAVPRQRNRFNCLSVGLAPSPSWPYWQLWSNPRDLWPLRHLIRVTTWPQILENISDFQKIFRFLDFFRFLEHFRKMFRFSEKIQWQGLWHLEKILKEQS